MDELPLGYPFMAIACQNASNDWQFSTLMCKFAMVVFITYRTTNSYEMLTIEDIIYEQRYPNL